MSGKARRCSGCGHIETKQTEGNFHCASCGSVSYTLYEPPGGQYFSPAPLENYERVERKPLEYKRGKNECTRCGSKLDNPDGSAYCANCEKYLGLD